MASAAKQNFVVGFREGVPAKAGATSSSTGTESTKQQFDAPTVYYGVRVMLTLAVPEA